MRPMGSPCKKYKLVRRIREEISFFQKLCILDSFKCILSLSSTAIISLWSLAHILCFSSPTGPRSERLLDTIPNCLSRSFELVRRLFKTMKHKLLYHQHCGRLEDYTKWTNITFHTCHLFSEDYCICSIPSKNNIFFHLQLECIVASIGGS